MALQDAKTPLKYGVISSGLNIILDAALIRPLAHGGLALATSLVATVNTVLLFRALRRKLDLSGGKKFVKSMAKIACAAVLMAIVISFAKSYLGGGDVSHQVVKLGICFLAGGGVYMIACAVLGVEEIGEITKILSKLKR